MKFIGIDPGKSGGMASIRCDENLGIVSYSAHGFATMTEREITRGLRKMIRGSTEAESLCVLIEKQGVRPLTDRPKNIATLHHQFGILHGCLLTLEVGYEDISPHAWQKTFKLLMPKGTESAAKKRKHKEKAQQFFPEVNVTLQTCDALLIAEYGRRLHYKGKIDG